MKKRINRRSKTSLISIIFEFTSISNVLSLKALSEAVLLAKSLKSPYHVENKLYPVYFYKYILNLLFL